MNKSLKEKYTAILICIHLNNHFDESVCVILFIMGVILSALLFYHKIELTILAKVKISGQAHLESIY
jgi:small basic protein